MKIYQVKFEDFRNMPEIVEEIQYVLANDIGQIWEAMGGEGVGYDKEMISISEVIEAVRILPGVIQL